MSPSPPRNREDIQQKSTKSTVQQEEQDSPSSIIQLSYNFSLTESSTSSSSSSQSNPLYLCTSEEEVTHQLDKSRNDLLLQLQVKQQAETEQESLSSPNALVLSRITIRYLCPSRAYPSRKMLDYLEMNFGSDLLARVRVEVED